MSGPAPRPRAARVDRLPLVLLGVMTIATVGGPLGVFVVLRGGVEPAWPPDRPVEWVVLIGTCLLVAALMIVVIGLGLANLRAMKAEAAKSPRSEVEP